MACYGHFLKYVNLTTHKTAFGQTSKAVLVRSFGKWHGFFLAKEVRAKLKKRRK